MIDSRSERRSFASRFKYFFACGCLIGGWGAAAFASPDSSLRPWTVEDHLSTYSLAAVEEIDSRRLLLIGVKPRPQAPTFGSDSFTRFGADRSTAWIIDLSRRQVRPLAPEIPSLWFGRISTSGQHQICYAYDGRTVRLCVFDRQSETIRKLDVVPNFGFSMLSPIADWLDNDRIVVAATTSLTPPFEARSRASAEAIAAAQRSSWSGAASTLSLMGAGTYRSPPRSNGLLIEIDVNEGTTRTLANGEFARVVPSGDGRLVAGLRLEPVILPTQPTRLSAYDITPHSLALIDRSTGTERLIDCGGCNVLGSTVAWSRDGELLFTAVREGRQIRFRFHNESLEILGVEAASEPVFAWAPDVADESLLLPDGSQVRLHDGMLLMGMPYQQLVPLAEVGSAHFWQPGANFLTDGRPQIQIRTHIPLASGEIAKLVDVTTGASNEIAPASAAEKLIYVGTQSATAVYLRQQFGTSNEVIVASPGHRWTALELNESWNRIERARSTTRQWTDLKGVQHNDWLLEPALTSRRRGVVVTLVYPGQTYGTSDPQDQDRRSLSMTDVNILVGAGYTVLLPSFPGLYQLEGREMLDRTAERVRAARGHFPVTAGQAQVVFGHSLGGYAALGLSTRLSGISATIASAPIADPATLYFSFDPAFRFAPDLMPNWNPPNLFNMWAMESGIHDFKAPPVAAAEAYKAGSPMARMERLQGDLLLIHSDLDYLSIAESERVFSLGARYGKDVCFARFWGDFHVLSNPQNIRDYWRVILGFIDAATRQGNEADRQAFCQ